MKRNHVIKQYVEKEVPDDVPVNYHLGRLMKIIGGVFFIFLVLLSLLPHWTEELDNPVILFWFVFCFILLPAALFGFSRIKKMSKNL